MEINEHEPKGQKTQRRASTQNFVHISVHPHPHENKRYAY